MVLALAFSRKLKKLFALSGILSFCACGTFFHISQRFHSLLNVAEQSEAIGIADPSSIASIHAVINVHQILADELWRHLSSEGHHKVLPEKDSILAIEQQKRFEILQ